MATKNAHYKARRRGSSVGKSGRHYYWQQGDVFEALDGDLDHVGSLERLDGEKAPKAVADKVASDKKKAAAKKAAVKRAAKKARIDANKANK